METHDIRDLLRCAVERRRFGGASYRSLASDCGLKSPNYLQQVIAGRRRLRLKTADAIAKGLGMPPKERRLLLALVRLEQDPTEAGFKELRGAVAGTNKREVRDISIHDSWINGVLFELAGLTHPPLTEANAAERLRGLASPAEIAGAFKGLVRRGWLIPSDTRGDGSAPQYRRGALEFSPIDDVRRIDIQRSHLRFLDMAKHRINDALDRREYRGLTVALPMAAFPQVRALLRDCFEKISALADEVEGADTVLRIQCCAFEVAPSSADRRTLP